jgi:hypothetical protein
VAVPAEPAGGAPSLPLRWLSAFGRFWWEFLIGETPELFVGAVAAVAVAALICTAGRARTWAGVVLVVLVALLLALSVWRAARRAP